jgi:hypothetical protein
MLTKEHPPKTMTESVLRQAATFIFMCIVLSSCTTVSSTDARLDLVFGSTKSKNYTEYVITEHGQKTRLDLSPLYHPAIVVDLNATMADYGGFDIFYSPSRNSIVLFEDSGASESRTILIQKQKDAWKVYRLNVPNDTFIPIRQVSSITDKVAVVTDVGGVTETYSLERLKAKP